MDVSVFGGPAEYLYGAVKRRCSKPSTGAKPFPRVAPPWRHGVDELGDGAESAADVELAEPGGEGIAPPTLANNVETLKHAAMILAEGPEWFRARHAGNAGLDPVHGDRRTRRHGVAEIPMGTILRQAIDDIGGGVESGRGDRRGDLRRGERVPAGNGARHAADL